LEGEREGGRKDRQRKEAAGRKEDTPVQNTQSVGIFQYKILRQSVGIFQYKILS
jgi:hypothetical protein